MKFDIALHADYPDIAARAAEYERQGFAGVFTLEANRDVFFPLFAVAQSGAQSGGVDPTGCSDEGLRRVGPSRQQRGAGISTFSHARPHHGPARRARNL